MDDYKSFMQASSEARKHVKECLENFSRCYDEFKKNPTEELFNQAQSKVFIMAIIFFKYAIYFAERDSFLDIPIDKFKELWIFADNDMEI